MRTARVTYREAKYHVSALVNRQEMIFDDDFYKTLLLEYIAKAKKKYTFTVSSLCIMDNHFHMVVTPMGDSELSHNMKSILGGFAVKFNKINNYKGHVWCDRFKSKVIETIEYFELVVSYIANNPVRAGIVIHPLEYKFSSISAVLGKDWGSPYKKVRKLFLTILEVPPEGLRGTLGRYLGDFNSGKETVKTEASSFADRKPGRPRKV